MSNEKQTHTPEPIDVGAIDPERDSEMLAAVLGALSEIISEADEMARWCCSLDGTITYDAVRCYNEARDYARSLTHGRIIECTHACAGIADPGAIPALIEAAETVLAAAGASMIQGGALDTLRAALARVRREK